MKKIHVILIIFLSIIILGFLIGLFIPSLGTACTKMGCLCELSEDGERYCNSCSFSNPIFITGLFNVVKDCRGSEIITCEDAVQIDTRIDFDKENCEKDFYVLWFNLERISNNQDTGISSNLEN